MADYTTPNAQIQPLRDMLEASRNVRRPHEGQWYLNLAFYLGHQWLGWDGRRLFQPTLGDDQETPVDNRIRPIVRTAIAKATKNRPVFTAAPHTLDEEDVEGAMLSEAAFDWAWDEFDLTRKRRLALFWRENCAAGFWKICWDPTKGDSVDVLVTPEGKPMVDANGRVVRPGAPGVDQVLSALPPEQRPQAKTVAMGDVSIEIRSPFQIYPDPNADETGLESADWLIEESIQRISVLQDRYGAAADGLQPDLSGGQGPAHVRLPGISRDQGGAKDSVCVYELWQKPCPEYRQGRRVVWSQESILYDGANDYGWLPHVMFGGDPSGGFWPDAPVTPLISPQTRLNKRLAQIDENAERIGNPPLTYPEGMEEAMEGWQGLPGEHLQYPMTGAPDARPDFLQVPEVPGYIREDRDFTVQSLREISGQNEVASGIVPAGVTAASAINLLQEANDTQMGPSIEEMEMALAGAGRRVLELMGKYYVDERFIRMAGEEGGWDIKGFRGKQLRGHYDLKVQAGSGMPRSKAAKQAAMQQVLDLMMRYGGPEAVNQRSMRKFMRDFEVGGLERLFDELNESESKVVRENRRMAMGAMVPVNSWDDHHFEIEAHNEFRRSAKYERISVENPLVVQLLDTHVRAHQQALIAQNPPVDASTGQQLPISAPGALSQPAMVNGGSPQGVDSQSSPNGSVSLPTIS